MNTLLDTAERYLGHADLGTQGKMLGISKMFQDRDVAMLKMKKAVATLRPRGVLSGFLAILPSLRAAVYIPPTGGKVPATVLRLRLSEDVWQQGAILSCYWDDGVLILEDVLQWGGKRTWATKTFEQRWTEDMQAFCDAWMPDDALSGCTIRLADYVSLDQLESQTLLPSHVLEFIWVEDVGMRRFIWVPDRNAGATESGAAVGTADVQRMVARRESTVGPDIFSLWTPSGERLPQIALVRTLAVSRALRLHVGDEFYVKTTWNKMFERHEILGIALERAESLGPQQNESRCS